MVDIVSINLDDRLAFTSEGQYAPITNLIDEEGDETDDTAAAVSFVVKLAEDRWLADSVGSFRRARDRN